MQLNHEYEGIVAKLQPGNGQNALGHKAKRNVMEHTSVIDKVVLLHAIVVKSCNVFHSRMQDELRSPRTFAFLFYLITIIGIWMIGALVLSPAFHRWVAMAYHPRDNDLMVTFLAPFAGFAGVFAFIAWTIIVTLPSGIMLGWAGRKRPFWLMSCTFWSAAEFRQVEVVVRWKFDGLFS